MNDNSYFNPFTFLMILCVFGLFQCAPKEENTQTAVSLQQPTNQQWTQQQANDWYARQPWLVGTNYTPAYAVNQLEMWQEETFDPELIDKELALSASIGMNTHRVFLHNLLWEQDQEGFLNRIEQFLSIADQHDIKIMLVLFDGVWNPNPELGKQPDPIPHKHNSGWVQAPGAEYLSDESSYPKLEAYVKGVVSHFAEDQRVLIWDIFNEPENENKGSYPDLELEDKYHRAFEFLQAAFGWAKEARPSQPITAAVWGNFTGPDGRNTDSLTSISEFMLHQSDIISFHTYATPDIVPLQIEFLQRLNRPILCTEYLARSRNNTFENLLPLFKENQIGAYNWGLISGKTNTIYPWDSWDSTYVAAPELWHHDIFRSDGTPYSQRELNLIMDMTGN